MPEMQIAFEKCGSFGIILWENEVIGNNLSSKTVDKQGFSIRI
jgi:hypothetical protein